MPGVWEHFRTVKVFIGDCRRELLPSARTSVSETEYIRSSTRKSFAHFVSQASERFPPIFNFLKWLVIIRVARLGFETS
jgi:hypothetical protein